MASAKQQWDSLWINGNLACLNHSLPCSIITNGAIAVHEGRIVWIGPLSALEREPEKCARTIYDLHGKWLSPGLIDCHTHLIYGGQRVQEFEQILSGKSYEEILKEGGGIYSTVAATRKVDEHSLLSLSVTRLKLWLHQGVTTVEIKSGYGLSLESEHKILNVAKSLEEIVPITIKKTFLGAHTLSPEFTHSDEYINYLCEEMLPYLVQHQLVDAVDAFCETVGFNTRQIAKLFDKAKSLHVPVKLHAEQLSHCGGAKLAAEYNALSADHLEFATEKDIEAMGNAGVVAVLLPSAYYFLNLNQKPRVDLFRQYNVPIAIATDHNPGTSPNTSLLLAMNMACVLFRLTPWEALLGVTKHAAKALGMDKTHGSLEVGKNADFAIWDVDHPAELSYYLGVNPCVGVVKNGIPLQLKG